MSDDERRDKTWRDNLERRISEQLADPRALASAIMGLSNEQRQHLLVLVDALVQAGG